ncbi:MAG: hypothetical protein GX957_09475, partial [Clostridiaceae bacterium]|nr:hypothetical protein [Clostridiaceae bacterium]
MDTQALSCFATYMGVYEYLSRGSYTASEVTKHLANDQNSKTASKHSKKAADGELEFISLNEEERLVLDKSALIDYLLEFCTSLNLEADIHVKRKQKPEDGIASITDSHSKSFQDMKSQY